MKDISYHILDIVQNSLNAGATSISVELTEITSKGNLQLKISDNGRGMPAEVLKKVTDPFFTSSVTKKVGLGLPLLKQNSEQTGGYFNIHSDINIGTTVDALFKTSHIDMIPAGDLSLTIRLLIASNPDIDLLFRVTKDENSFEIDTSVMRQELENVSVNAKDVLDHISDFVRNSLNTLSVYSN